MKTGFIDKNKTDILEGDYLLIDSCNPHKAKKFVDGPVYLDNEGEWIIGYGYVKDIATECEVFNVKNLFDNL